MYPKFIRNLVVSLAVVVSFGTIGMASTAHGQTSQGRTDEVRFGLLPGLALYLPLWIAEDKGFFKEERVQPVYINIQGGGAQTMAALLGGSFDMTDLSFQAVAIANEKGRNLRLLAGNYTDLAYALMVRQDLAEPTAADNYPAIMHKLRGKKVAVTSIGSSTYLVLQKMLERAGMTVNDVEIVQTGSVAVAPMVAKQIDAAITLEPNVSILADQLNKARVVLDLRKPEQAASAGLDGLIYDAWAATEDVAKQDRVVRATNALDKGMRVMKDPATDVRYLMQLVRKNLKMDVTDEVLRKQIESMIPGYHVVIPRLKVKRSFEILGMAEQPYEKMVIGAAMEK